MQDKSDLEEILRVAQRGSDFAEIFMERTESTRIGCEARQDRKGDLRPGAGAGIRAVRATIPLMATPTALDKESLLPWPTRWPGPPRPEVHRLARWWLQRRESPVDRR